MDKSIKIQGILGKKITQSQRFNEAGKRIPVTVIEAGPCLVMQIKNQVKDGYQAVQLGFGKTKPPRFLKEVWLEEETTLKIGDAVNIQDVFNLGDTVKITGLSRGKGFTGVVKRHHFKGGPRTHGQSDRERAPGSIGQTTTPGRVYKGKRMAGRSGGQRATIKNLKVIEIDNENNKLVVSGLVPGAKNGFLTITKIR